MPSLHRRALTLEGATIAWNVLEGLAAIIAGLLAGSVALVAFGLDSSVEVLASAVVVWELRGADRRRERRAVKAIGSAYLVVAVYVLLDAGNALRVANRPEASPIGMLLLASTVVVMAGLGVAKLRVGRERSRRSSDCGGRTQSWPSGSRCWPSARGARRGSVRGATKIRNARLSDQTLELTAPELR